MKGRQRGGGEEGERERERERWGGRMMREREREVGGGIWGKWGLCGPGQSKCKRI